MISCVDRGLLMEDEKTVSLRRTHQIPLERSCHCLRPVFVFNVQRSVPHFVFCSLRFAARVFLFSCQTLLNSVSLRPRFLDREFRRAFQLRGHCSDTQSTQARQQFHSGPVIVVECSLQQFLQMHFVLASHVSARGFIFFEFTTFASKSGDLATDFEVMNHNAPDFLESECNCATASTCPANSEASFSRFCASDASCSPAAIEFRTMISFLKASVL